MFLDVEDNYQTVVFKLVSAFKWISEASKSNGDNLKWILKLDDDVLININELKIFIEQLQQKDLDSIYCHVYAYPDPARGQGEKWSDFLNTYRVSRFLLHST